MEENISLIIDNILKLKRKGCDYLYSRGNGLLKEEKSLEEIHKIREKIYEMDEKEKKDLLKKIKEKYKSLFE